MTFKVITPAGAPPPIAPYSPGALVNGVLYVSGTLDFTQDGQCAHPGDAAAQTRGVLEIIKSVVEKRGRHDGRYRVQSAVYQRLEGFSGDQQGLRRVFSGAKPARYCIACTLVRPEFLVEIASTAHIAK